PILLRWGGAALALGLLMSLVALNSDLLRSAGFQFPRREPSDRMRGWKSTAGGVEKIRAEVEGRLAERVFMIADQRDRASELAFYFRDQRLEGPGHPPVYIIESQDIQNQFSFWPRYDEFVEAPADATRSEGDVYTEESGINPFAGRTAIYIQASGKTDVPRNIGEAFASTELYATIEVRRHGKLLRTLQVFVCKKYRTLPL
ncbi:MAG: hypothetical protein ABR589_05480, partial [Chthoniobacterales bacterium]